MEQSFATSKSFIIPLVAIIWPTMKNKVKFLSPHFWSITAVSGKQFSICVWKLLDHLIGPTDMTTAASTTTTTTTTMTLTTVPHKDFVFPRTASILDDCWNEITIWKRKKEKMFRFLFQNRFWALCVETSWWVRWQMLEQQFIWC